MADKPTYAELEQQVKQLDGRIAGLERAEKINQTLYRVSSAVSTTENLDELYTSIHEILHDVIGLRNFYIAIYHRDENSISFPYFRDEFDDDYNYIDNFTETNSLTGEVILSGSPLLMTKKMLAERARENRILGTVPQVWMGFPLKVKGDVIGVIAAQSYDNPNQFSHSDLDFLTSVSDQIAIAIERKRIEDALLESENRFRTMADTMPCAIYRCALDADRTMAFISRQVLEITGYPASDFIGNAIRTYWRIIYPEDVKRVDEQVRTAVAAKESWVIEYRICHADGSLRSVYEEGRAIYDNEGVARFLDGFILDNTDRKMGEESLRRSEERYRTLLEASPDAIVAYDRQGSIIYINPAFERTYGWSAAELAGRKIDFVPEHEKEKTRQAVMRNLSGEDVSLETQRFAKDGRLLDIHLRTAIFHDDVGNLQGTIVIHRDITDRVRADEETKRLRNLLGNIVNSMPSVLVGIDRDIRVTQWNRRAEEVTGIKAVDAAGQMLDSVFPRLASEMEKIKAAIRERQPQHEPKRLYRGATETRFEDVTIYPLIANGIEGAVIRVDDVTERVRLEEMMIQSEKMMSVGGLAAGMAHEINNPLAGIMQNTQIARNRLSGASPADRRAAEECGTTLEAIKAFHQKRGLMTILESALESGSRAAKIVNNMLSFSRMGDASMSKQDLAGLLDATLELAQSDYDLKRKYDFRKIKIIRDYHPETPAVICAASKIQQVFLNIFKNGAESMAANEDLGEPPCFILKVSPDQGRVRVEIKDNGPGMDADVCKRIFEPFFTTKSTDGGTGLGLSVSYFIITDNHNGSMTVESEPGEGARFTIHLPI